MLTQYFAGNENVVIKIISKEQYFFKDIADITDNKGSAIYFYGFLSFFQRKTKGWNKISREFQQQQIRTIGKLNALVSRIKSCNIKKNWARNKMHLLNYKKKKTKSKRNGRKFFLLKFIEKSAK